MARGVKTCSSCKGTTGPRALKCPHCLKPFSFKADTATAQTHNTPTASTVASVSYGRAPISDGRGSIVVTPNAKPDVKFVEGNDFHKDIIEWADRVRDAYNENLSNQALLYWLSSYFGVAVGTEKYEHAKAILSMEFPNYHVALVQRS